MMAVGLCPHLCLVLSYHSLSLVPTHLLLAPRISSPYPLWED